MGAKGVGWGGGGGGEEKIPPQLPVEIPKIKKAVCTKVLAPPRCKIDFNLEW